jgi:hypothetical protein
MSQQARVYPIFSRLTKHNRRSSMKSVTEIRDRVFGNARQARRRIRDRACFGLENMEQLKHG